MKRLALLLIALLATGCGIEDETSGSSFDCEYNCSYSGPIQESGPRFKLVYSPADVPTKPLMAMVEAQWQYVLDCSGFKSIGARAANYPLTIHWVDDDFVYERYIGVIWYDTRYTRIILRDLNSRYNNSTLRHELVHWLLYLTGFDSEDNHSHNSNLFSDCV